VNHWICRLWLLSIFLAAPLSAVELNWVKNGDFKTKDAWTGNELTVEKGRDGGEAAVLENKETQWSEYKQSIALPKPVPPVVEVSFGMKSWDVKPGQKDWELARMNVTFFDEKGTQVGGWPEDPGRAFGTIDWKTYAGHYAVPAGAATVSLSLELGNATGKVWFDRVSLFVYDFDSKPCRPAPPSPTRNSKADRRPRRTTGSSTRASKTSFPTTGPRPNRLRRVTSPRTVWRLKTPNPSGTPRPRW